MKKPIWPPPKPLFIRSVHTGQTCYSGLSGADFNVWYAEYIEALGPAVEVFGKDDNSEWGFTKVHIPEDTHKALLIGIQTLKEETADEILVEVLSAFRDGYEEDQADALERVKDYLTRKTGVK